MNFFLLLIVEKIRRTAATCGGKLAAAAVGAAGVVIFCLVRLPWELEIVLQLFMIPGLMVFIAYKKKNIETWILNFVTLYMTAFLLGGIFTFIFSHSTIQNCLYQLNYHRSYEKPKIFFVIPALTALCMSAAGFWLKLRRFSKIRHTVDAVLIIHGVRVGLRALIDTGNRLYEPIGHQPVSIVEMSCVSRYFFEEDKLKLKVVPFHSIGKKEGILYALPVDTLEIPERGIKKESALVAFYDGTIGGGCHMILHADLTE